MNFSEFKPTVRTSTTSRIVFTNVGSGIGIFRTANGPVIEYNSLSGIGLDIQIGPDERTINIDATKIIDKLDTLNAKYNTLSTAILSVETAAHADSAQARNRISRLEAKPSYILPETLVELAQMPRFHGCVPVIENGTWAALNLSNEFFQKYETKLTSLNMDLDALVTNDIDARETAHELKLNIEELDTNARVLDKILSEEIKKVKTMLIRLSIFFMVIIVLLSIKVIM